MEKSGEHADLNKTEDEKQQQHGQLSDNMIESSSTATDNTSSSHHTTVRKRKPSHFIAVDFFMYILIDQSLHAGTCSCFTSVF